MYVWCVLVVNMYVNVCFYVKCIGGKIGGVAPNALHICVGGSYVLPTVVEALCELPRA